MTSKLLQGLRVLELSEVWAGPMGGTLLGDLGADVVKVESYPRASQTRPLVEGGAGIKPGDGPPYERGAVHHLANRNKRNIAINLRDPGAVEPFHRLLRWADVLYEGYSAGTIDQMGWGWDILRGVNPRLVMVSMPGWGVRGPYQGYVTLGSGLDAAAGHAAVRGYPGDPPEQTRPIYHSDATGALTLVFALVSALRRREQSGKGVFVDLSQIEVLAWQLPGLYAEWTENQRRPPVLGNRDPHVVPHDVYPAIEDDSWVVVAAETDAQWAGLATALGHPDWAAAGHPWATIPGRLAARDAIDAAITDFTRARTSFETADLVSAAGAIAAPAVAAPEMLANPQLMGRNWLQTVEHRYAGVNLHPGFLWSVSPDPPSWDRPSGLVGEHNQEVLAEMGLDAGDIARLEADGVIGTRYSSP